MLSDLSIVLSCEVKKIDNLQQVSKPWVEEMIYRGAKRVRLSYYLEQTL